MWTDGIVDFGIVEIFADTATYAQAFNFFFTVVWIFGLVAVSLVLLMRVISRS